MSKFVDTAAAWDFEQPRPDHDAADAADAILAAVVAGDHAAADALAALSDTPPPAVSDSKEESRTVVLESGFTGTVTDSAGRERHYVDGKQVASPGAVAPGADARTPHPAEADPPHVDPAEVEAAVGGHPAAKSPGFVAAVKAKVSRAATRVAALLHDAALYSPQILEVFGAVADTPDDMKKLGYNPASAGGGQHRVDDLKDFGPLTTYQAVNLGSLALAKAYLWAKGKIAGKGKTEADDTARFAALMHEILKVLAEEFGWSSPPEPGEIEAAIRNAKGVA